jgi:glycosyltransferase involved in cell wall biosynthesis
MTGLSLVSVVTPFFNTADFLRECIESVLAQTYTRFEYLLVDNHSTDGSAAIAAEYARKDSRIRVIRNPRFVAQVPNYNGALRHVTPEARYVKVVQADDWIFPECLEKMVGVAEAHPTTAIISSYRIRGGELSGGGIEWPTEFISGRSACRLQLLGGRYVFGSPTTLLYRADLLAKRDPFYSETSLHDDSDLCYEELANADLGFVHQVLSFSRVGNGGELTSIETYFWTLLDSYMTLRKYGPHFLSDEELSGRMRPVRAEYLRILAECRLLGREPEFWQYHRRGLATVGEDLPSPLTLAPHIARAALKTAVKPWWLWRERARLKRVRNDGVRSSAIAQGEK